MIRIPSYRRQKSGQARVTLGGKDYYLGPYNSRESREAYQRLVGEYIASLGRAPIGPEISLAELCAGYKRFAAGYYVGPDRKPTAWYDFIKAVLLHLGQTAYARRPAAEFGPLALKAYRNAILAEGAGRITVNKKIDIVKRAFKWAASEELISAEVYHALRVVEGLRRGKSSAKESKPVLPVDDHIVEATLPHLPQVIADMVRLQRLTGMRPAEVCIMRPGDIDRDKAIWEYRPSHHKTEHHGRERLVFIGPRGQEVLRAYLDRDPSEPCFIPRESETRRRQSMLARRQTPLHHGNRAGTNRKRKPRWAPGSQYTTDAYRRAISRGCELAFKMPDDLNPQQRREWRERNVWSPNQLRHTAATEIRKQFGIEAAQVALGHAGLDVTQVYAERDLSRAADVMLKVG